MYTIARLEKILDLEMQNQKTEMYCNVLNKKQILEDRMWPIPWA